MSMCFIMSVDSKKKDLTVTYRHPLESVEQSVAMQKFVTEEVPGILADMKNRTLNLQVLMEAQHRCALALAQSAPENEPLREIANGLSQYAEADLALAVADISEREYWLRDPGLTEEQYAGVKASLLTVGDVLQLRPEIFVAPIVRPMRFTN